MILSFQTDRPGQTRQTQIRLLLQEQFDQGLHYLQFRLHLLDALLYGKASLFNFRVTTANFAGVQIFRSFTVYPKNVTVMILSFQTGRLGKQSTCSDQTRFSAPEGPVFQKQSHQGIHCLPFWMHYYSNFFWCPIISDFYGISQILS